MLFLIPTWEGPSGIRCLAPFLQYTRNASGMSGYHAAHHSLRLDASGFNGSGDAGVFAGNDGGVVGS